MDSIGRYFYKLYMKSNIPWQGYRAPSFLDTRMWNLSINVSNVRTKKKMSNSSGPHAQKNVSPAQKFRQRSWMWRRRRRRKGKWSIDRASIRWNHLSDQCLLNPQIGPTAIMLSGTLLVYGRDKEEDLGRKGKVGDALEQCLRKGGKSQISRNSAVFPGIS